MPDYRRLFVPSGTYFFTVVTYRRAPLLTKQLSRTLLREAWKNVQERYPFSTDAICLLPDHIHCIWTLPEGDFDFPIRWAEIKRLFSMQYHKIHSDICLNRLNEKSQVWQSRFWEHMIRDEHDLNNHIDYIHINPVKHQLVSMVKDWPWSSFHRFVRLGLYDTYWGIGDQSESNALFGE
jgi:putative transposase